MPGEERTREEQAGDFSGVSSFGCNGIQGWIVFFSPAEDRLESLRRKELIAYQSAAAG
jgi:hypothetical protein